MKKHQLIKTITSTFVIAMLLTMVITGTLVVHKVQALATQPPPGLKPTPRPLAPVISVDPVAIVSNQTAQLVTVPLTVTNSGDAQLEWNLYDAYENIAWEDNFDSYATGSSMHGQGGWKGWANDPAATAYTSDVQAVSPPNSVDINGASDLVHEYSGYNAGSWTYTAWQYIPTDFTGESYFILLNQYDDGGVTNNWSVQVDFIAATNTVANTGISAGTLPLIRGQWVELRVEIDLTNNTTSFYYNNELLYSGTWTEEVSGGGIKNLAAVDLFANAASPVYYDDISLGQLVDIPWLSADPTSGTTPAGGSSGVDVLLDATGLAPDVYTATLYAASNDPVNPIISIPVTMNVLADADLGISISDNPDPVNPGEPLTYALTASNSGPDAASGVTVEDTLPAGVTYVSASAGCVEAGGVVNCTVGDLASGANVELSILVNAPSIGGTITNTAMITGNVVDPNPANDSDSEVTTVTSTLSYSFLPIVYK